MYQCFVVFPLAKGQGMGHAQSGGHGVVPKRRKTLRGLISSPMPTTCSIKHNKASCNLMVLVPLDIEFVQMSSQKRTISSLADNIRGMRHKKS